MKWEPVKVIIIIFVIIYTKKREIHGGEGEEFLPRADAAQQNDNK